MRLLAPLVVLALVAGCLSVPEHPEEGEHVERPPVGEGRQSLRVNGMIVTWQDPASGREPRELEWTVSGQKWEDGIFHVPAEMPSIEGWDFRFTLRYRLDGPWPVRLAYDEDLSQTNTFNFTYEEQAFWAGRSIGEVVRVEPDSFVDVHTWERATGDAAGHFRLNFTGVCDPDAGPAPCEEEHRTVLDGVFPKPRGR